MTWIGFLLLGLLALKWAAGLWLERLNQRYVQAHATVVPQAFRSFLDAVTYAKSAQYTLAKSRLHQVESTAHFVVLVALLSSGILPLGFHQFMRWLGESAWSSALFILAVGLILSLTSLPFDWHAQFNLEAQYGFNKTTPRLWLVDCLKGLLLAVLLGYPLLVLVLKMVHWMGGSWWLGAWGCVVGFQLLMLVAAPALILPLFNRFTPLPAGSLRERLLGLAARANFRTKQIQVMDGSKRSTHSNAFFTGFGRFRKIVLFDTLIQQLGEAEVEAVLAHEIGHAQKKHVLKVMLLGAVGLLAMFAALAWLAQQAWFYRAFGFAPRGLAPAFLLFAMLSGAVSFWLSPLLNYFSRRHEYEADTCAARLVGQPDSLIRALRLLNQKNLSNLTPHPLYSLFHYSHPTLLEREQALRAADKQPQNS